MRSVFARFIAGLLLSAVVGCLLPAPLCADTDNPTPVHELDPVIELAVDTDDLPALRRIHAAHPEAIRQALTTTHYDGQYHHYPILIRALEKGNPAKEVVAFLLEAGCSVDVGCDGFSAALYLNSNADPNGNMLNALIAHGFDVNTPDFRGNTPLHYACDREDTRLMVLLLARGARPDLRNEIGDTPLISYLHERMNLVDDHPLGSSFRSLEPVIPVYLAMLPVPGWAEFLLWAAGVGLGLYGVVHFARKPLPLDQPDLKQLAAVTAPEGVAEPPGNGPDPIPFDVAAGFRLRYEQFFRWRRFAFVPFVSGCVVTLWVALDPAWWAFSSTRLLYLYAAGYVVLFVLWQLPLRSAATTLSVVLAGYSALGVMFLVILGQEWAHLKTWGPPEMCYGAAVLMTGQAALMGWIAYPAGKVFDQREIVSRALDRMDRVDFETAPDWDQGGVGRS